VLEKPKYSIELRDQVTGDLVHVFRNFINAKIKDGINRPSTFSCSIPADDTKINDISKSSEIWVRTDKSTIIGKFIVLKQTKEHNQSRLYVKVDGEDYSRQLATEYVHTYDTTVAGETISDILTALFVFQENDNPITIGTIDAAIGDLNRAIVGTRESILAIILRISSTLDFDNYFYVDTDRTFNWTTSMGEDSGQQIRFKKNLTDISEETDYSKMVSRVYAYTVDENGDEVDLSDVIGYEYEYLDFPYRAWKWHKQIKIDDSYIEGTHQYFQVPVLIDSCTYLASHALANGYDIMFVSEDYSTVLNYERVSWNEATGHFEGWVRIPELTYTKDTYFWMFFGNPDIVADEANPTETWTESLDDLTNNYVAVYHMNDLTTTSIKDSADYENEDNGTKGAGDPLEADGKLGKAQDFNGGAGNEINVVDTDDLDLIGAHTFSFWIKTGGLYDDYMIFKKDVGTRGYRLYLDLSGGLLEIGFIQYNVDDSPAYETYLTSSMSLAENTWYFMSMTMDENKNIRFFKNGEYIEKTTFSIIAAALTATLDIGGTNWHFASIFDECFISKVARSDDFIKTLYNATNDPENFCKVQYTGYFMGSAGRNTIAIKDDSLIYPDTLYEYTESYVTKYAKPIVKYRIKVLELAELASPLSVGFEVTWDTWAEKWDESENAWGQPIFLDFLFDKFYLGSVVKIIDEKLSISGTLKIVGIERILQDAFKINLEVSNVSEGITDRLIDLIGL